MDRKRRKKPYVSRFIMLLHVMMNTAAFQSLSGDAIKLLLAIWQRHNGQNNGAISFSVREAAALLRGGKSTASKRFAELVEKGFLRVHTKGIFTVKLATTWRLTVEKCDGQPATREYQYWRPAAVREQNHDAVPAADTSGTSPKDREGQNVRILNRQVSAAGTLSTDTQSNIVSLRRTHINLAIGGAGDE